MYVTTKRQYFWEPPRFLWNTNSFLLLTSCFANLLLILNLTLYVGNCVVIFARTTTIFELFKRLSRIMLFLVKYRTNCCKHNTRRCSKNKYFVCSKLKFRRCFQIIYLLCMKNTNLAATRTKLFSGDCLTKQFPNWRTSLEFIMHINLHDFFLNSGLVKRKHMICTTVHTFLKNLKLCCVLLGKYKVAQLLYVTIVLVHFLLVFC